MTNLLYQYLYDKNLVSDYIDAVTYCGPQRWPIEGLREWLDGIWGQHGSSSISSVFSWVDAQDKFYKSDGYWSTISSEFKEFCDEAEEGCHPYEAECQPENDEFKDYQIKMEF